MSDRRREPAVDPSQPAIEAVVFDCDGVLVDTVALTAHLVADFLVELGFDGPATRPGAWVGSTTAALVAWIDGNGSDLPNDWRARLEHLLDAEVVRRVRPIRGAADVLDRLGLPFAVVSNSGRAELDAKLCGAGLADRCGRHVFSADEVALPKPAPDLYLAAARHLDVDPGRCLAVEDTSVGARAALAAGMSCAVVANPFLVDADPVSTRTTRLAELVELLDLVGVGSHPPGGVR